MATSRQRMHELLADIARDCRTPGWEGENSVAVEDQTLSFAAELIESLPPACPAPEISAEPDGNINLEWYVNPQRVLSVSVTPAGVLHWAALVDDEDPRGTCPFTGEAPPTLLYWINRVIDA